MVDRVEDGVATQWYRELIGDPPEPEWHHVITLSPVIRYSPHYVHHHAEGTIRQFEYVLDLPTLTDQARRLAITEFFGRLKNQKLLDSAYEYADQLRKVAEQKQPVDVADLPAKEAPITPE